MNHLAHCLLARNNPDWIVGNMVADHVRGSVQDQPYSAGIRAGIAQHRWIDAYTDTHPTVRQACELLRSTQQKFAPIVVDVCFDYFLARHWQLFAPDISLTDFGINVCAALQKSEEILPEPLKKRLPLMTEHNFLTTYKTTDGMLRAFRNIANRSTFANHLDQAVSDVLAQETTLEAHFLSFFPELSAYISAKMVL